MKRECSLCTDADRKHITQHRPLQTIADPRERVDAKRLREWFTEVFPHAQPT